MLRRKKNSYLATVLLVIAFFAIPAGAQDRNIWQEYRPSLVMAMPINEKLIVWQYALGVYSPEKKLTTIGTAGPGIIYRPKAKKGSGGWFELWAGTLFAWTDNYHTTNSFELRPVVGVKMFAPNKRKLNIYNFARYEYRKFFQGNTSNEQPRFRDRTGIEIPLAKGDKRWAPGTFYTAGDVEPLWRLDDKFLEKIRQKKNGC